MKFFIEQIALCPPRPEEARLLLAALGLDEWATDTVTAVGEVRGESARNVAELAFNYQATRGVTTYDPLTQAADAASAKPLELEVLHYREGDNWMADRPARVSHLGMHVTHEEWERFDKLLRVRLGYKVAQAVRTTNHTNPAIAGKRVYDYFIYDTYAVLGVDLKFIIRHVL